MSLAANPTEEKALHDEKMERIYKYFLLLGIGSFALGAIVSLMTIHSKIK